MQKNGCVKVGDTDMYYAAFGEGKKNLVVLPGLSDGLWTVKGKAWLLAGSYKKFFNDYTVYMFSRKNLIPEGYSIEDMANDQAIAMQNLGIEKAIVMGVSQGGMIAQYLAASHGELVEKLVLVVTAPYANDTIKSVVTKWIEMTKTASHTDLMLDTAEKVYTKSRITAARARRPWGCHPGPDADDAGRLCPDHRDSRGSRRRHPSSRHRPRSGPTNRSRGRRRGR